jgi:hypothetical protein
MAIHHHLVVLAGHRGEVACTVLLKLSALFIMKCVILSITLDLLKQDFPVASRFSSNTRIDVRAPQGLFHAVAC